MHEGRRGVRPDLLLLVVGQPLRGESLREAQGGQEAEGPALVGLGVSGLEELGEALWGGNGGREGKKIVLLFGRSEGRWGKEEEEAREGLWKAEVSSRGSVCGRNGMK